MPVLEALTAGISVTGLELLSTALTETFGQDMVGIVELDKDDLRYKIRTSTKSDNVVLVVLDATAKDACKDIENGLFTSDKFYTYKDDADFAAHLNARYGLNLAIPEDMSDMGIPQDAIGGVLTQEKIESYENQISDRDGIIKSLNFKIAELSRIIEYGGYSVADDEFDRVSSENIELKGKLLDAQKAQETLQSEFDEYKKNNDSADEKVAQITAKLDAMRVDYETLNSECTNEKVASSKKSGVIRDKEAEIERLKKQLEGYKALKEKASTFDSDKEAYEASIKDLTKQLTDARMAVQNKGLEIERLEAQISTSASDSQLVTEYKDLLKKAEEEKSELQGKISELEQRISDLEEMLADAETDVSNLNDRITELEEEISKKESTITELNTRNLENEGKIRILEKSTNRDANIESSLTELTDLKRKYAELQSNVFSMISSRAYPKGNSKISLIPYSGISFKNIRFVFAGSTESRKGVYKCLLKEFSEVPTTKFLIVDAVSETYADYVLKIQRVVNGDRWFTDGGSVQQFLSSTCIPNTKVLSLGLNYINDSFLLTVDWAKRLQELESSGYVVVVMCGDISNIIGRVMFESFVELGASTVYVHGNSVGSRTVLSNMRGLTNAKNSTVVYFDYNKQMNKFFEKMSQICDCRIFNYGS